MNYELPSPTAFQLRRLFSRWLLALAVIWQALILYMPLAQAHDAQSNGSWVSICTMQGASSIWVDTNNNQEDSKNSKLHSHSQCPLCVLSHTSIAPPPTFGFHIHHEKLLGTGQFAFTAFYLTQSWSEPARGPPILLI